MSKRCVICLHRLAQDPEQEVVAIESDVDDWSSGSSSRDDSDLEILETGHDKGKEKLVVVERRKEEEDAWVARAKACSHVFHNDCLKRWIKASSSHDVTCPTCRSIIDQVQVSRYVGGSVLATYQPRKDEASSRKRRTTRSTVACAECGRSVAARSLATCDSCALEWHIRCAGLTARPTSHWYCPDCVWQGLDQAIGLEQSHGGLDGFLARAQTARRVGGTLGVARTRRRVLPTPRRISTRTRRATRAVRPASDSPATLRTLDSRSGGPPVQESRTASAGLEAEELLEGSRRNGGIFKKTKATRQVANTDPIALAKTLSSCRNQSQASSLSRASGSSSATTMQMLPSFGLDLDDEDGSVDFGYTRRQALSADAEARSSASASKSKSLLPDIADPNYLQLLFAQFDSVKAAPKAASSDHRALTAVKPAKSPGADEPDQGKETSKKATVRESTTSATWPPPQIPSDPANVIESSPQPTLYQYVSPLRVKQDTRGQPRETLDGNIKDWVYRTDLEPTQVASPGPRADAVEKALQEPLEASGPPPQLNLKYLIKDLVSEKLKPLYQTHELARDEYKSILRDCVHTLYRLMNSKQFCLDESGSIGHGNWKVDPKGHAQVDECVRAQLAQRQR